MTNRVAIVAVVENDVAMLNALERLMRAYGYSSELFTSAEMFLDRDSSAEIGCLILDIDLDGISGIELQRRLIAAGSAPPIIFISGKADESSQAQAAAMGCTAYLKKPFEASSMLEALKSTGM